MCYIVNMKLSVRYEGLEHATTKHGHPKMLNSDQGSQFTSLAWINKLSQLDIIISMDGKGRWADNVYVERFWRTLKRECIYANGVESVTQHQVLQSTEIAFIIGL